MHGYTSAKRVVDEEEDGKENENDKSDKSSKSKSQKTEEGVLAVITDLCNFGNLEDFMDKTADENFLAKVPITDDDGIKRQFSFNGCCGVHLGVRRYFVPSIVSLLGQPLGSRKVYPRVYLAAAQEVFTYTVLAFEQAA